MLHIFKVAFIDLFFFGHLGSAENTVNTKYNRELR